MCEQLKGALVSALYVLEIPLLLLSRPYNDVVTVWCERVGAVTNALAALAVTLPAFGWDLLPTMAILGVASVGTAIAAAASMVQSLVSLSTMVRQAGPACACWRVSQEWPAYASSISAYGQEIYSCALHTSASKRVWA